MTMRITRGQKIGSIPAFEIRDLLRKCRNNFRADWLTDEGYSKSQADAMIGSLLTQGYIEMDSDPRRFEKTGIPWHSVTDLGSSLIRASAARPISRAHAEKTLHEFMDRVMIVNEDARFLVRISKVVIFGSYLGEAAKLGDLDIACGYESKIEDPKLRIKQYIEHFRRSGRPRKHIISDMTWPQEEVELFLKNRQRTISLQPMHSFLGMPKDEGFRYQVLLGDAEEMTRLLTDSTVP